MPSPPQPRPPEGPAGARRRVTPGPAASARQRGDRRGLGRPLHHHHARAARRVGVALALVMLVSILAPVAAALDVSTKAIRVVGSVEYPDNVQSYSGQVPGFTGEFDGEGVAIAVLDTGVDAGPDGVGHPTFGNAWVAGAQLESGLCSTSKCVIEHMPGNPSEPWDPDDVNGHGTHVASTALGRGGGGAHRGVAPGARLVEVKIANDLGSANINDIRRGIEWVIDYNKGETNYGAPLYPVKVISISFASLSPHRDKDRDNAMQAIVKARDAGILTVVAAGNCGPGNGPNVQCDPTVNRNNGNTITSPGASPEALTVGAIDDMTTPDRKSVSRNEDEVAPYSSRGPNPGSSVTDIAWRKPDVVAPGSNIQAACATVTPGSQSASGNCTKSGTSMATPHVAGMAAILFQAGQFAKPGVGFTPERVKEIITSTAEDWSAPGWDPLSGYGYVDAYAALVEAVNRPPQALFQFRPATPLVGDEVRFDPHGTSDPDDQDTIERIVWDFGDGTDPVESLDVFEVVTHTYDRVGAYTVKLTVYDSRGASNTFERVVQVDPIPKEDLGRAPVPEISWWPKRPRVGDTVTFDGSNSTDPDNHKIVYYEWDFDKTNDRFGPESAGPNPKVSWSFDEPGPHRVGLRIKDEKGLHGLATVSVLVAPPPPGPPQVQFTNPKANDTVQAGPVLVTWVVVESAANSFTLFVDGVEEATLGSRQVRVDLDPGRHTLKVVARGEGGLGRAWVNFTAVDETLDANAAGGCTTHTHADGSQETHCEEGAGGAGAAAGASASTNCASHTHADGSSETHCTDGANAGADAGAAGTCQNHVHSDGLNHQHCPGSDGLTETGGADGTDDAPLPPAGVLLVLLVALAAARRRNRVRRRDKD